MSTPPEHSEHTHHHVTHSAPAAASPWFAVSMGLLGVIVGYGLAMATHGSALGLAPTQVAQAPTAPAPTAAASSAAPTGTPPATGIGPSEGKSSAPITLVEFTDFQCPFCGRHYTQTYAQIKKNYVDTGKVKYELRNFPLTSIHPNAMIGAEAATCAEKQGKFWEMHDQLFGNQQTWSTEKDPTATLEGYAKQLGLNTADFNKCLTGHETDAEIQKDMTDGNSAGITGTPGFWVIGPNGKTQQIKGAYPYTTFQTAFDGMLK